MTPLFKLPMPFIGKRGITRKWVIKVLLDPKRKEYIEEKYHDVCKKVKNMTPFYIAKVYGIKCCRVDFNDDLLAFSERSSSEDKGTIYINSNLGPYAQELLCGHELGHLFLHSDDDINLFDCKMDDPVKECEANYFATLILPHTILNTDIHSMSVCAFNKYILQKINLVNEKIICNNDNKKVLKLDLACLVVRKKKS